MRGKSRTEFIGYRAYMRELEIEAGLIDPEVERVAEELRRQDAFWGDAPTLEPKTG